jgi:hypothetical protein
LASACAGVRLVTHAPALRLVQCRCAEDDLDAAHAGALIDPLPLEAKDLLQAGPAAILGGQGAGSLQGAHFNATAVQVRPPGRGDRLSDDLGIVEEGGNVVTQGGLVVLGGQDIGPTLGDDLLDDRFLGEFGVAGHDPARQIESFQQGQGGADLVTVADGALGQHDSHLGGGRPPAVARRPDCPAGGRALSYRPGPAVPDPVAKTATTEAEPFPRPRRQAG